MHLTLLLVFHCLHLIAFTATISITFLLTFRCRVQSRIASFLNSRPHNFQEISKSFPREEGFQTLQKRLQTLKSRWTIVHCNCFHWCSNSWQPPSPPPPPPHKPRTRSSFGCPRHGNPVALRFISSRVQRLQGTHETREKSPETTRQSR